MHLEVDQISRLILLDARESPKIYPFFNTQQSSYVYFLA
jgi:hypothetical protein